jgi:SAM-dependent methyltransferase
MSVEKAIKSARSKGPIGKNAILPRIIPQLANKNEKILDFGCGKDMIHVKKLREQGYDVEGYDFSLPESYETICGKRYDVIYLSNVLNVQSNEEMLEDLYEIVWKCLKPNGCVVVNYPYSPRYLGWTARKMEAWLKERWLSVERVGKDLANNNIVWILM